MKKIRVHEREDIIINDCWKCPHNEVQGFYCMCVRTNHIANEPGTGFPAWCPLEDTK
ncbi:MAG: hypothetical protein GY718_14410 [Lentisphaerae bacterium]|nr:hypothetical protein [Lentisphaerota bacterium]